MTIVRIWLYLISVRFVPRCRRQLGGRRTVVSPSFIGDRGNPAAAAAAVAEAAESL